jgi:hypothetical protein
MRVGPQLKATGKTLEALPYATVPLALKLLREILARPSLGVQHQPMGRAQRSEHEVAAARREGGGSRQQGNMAVMTERADGTREWHLNGKRHREDGPAIEYANGRRDWFLNGKQVSTPAPADVPAPALVAV